MRGRWQSDILASGRAVALLLQPPRSAGRSWRAADAGQSASRRRPGGPWGRGPADPGSRGESLSAARRHDDCTIIGSGSKVRAGRALCVQQASVVCSRMSEHSTGERRTVRPSARMTAAQLLMLNLHCAHWRRGQVA